MTRSITSVRRTHTPVLLQGQVLLNHVTNYRIDSGVSLRFIQLATLNRSMRHESALCKQNCKTENQGWESDAMALQIASRHTCCSTKDSNTGARTCYLAVHSLLLNPKVVALSSSKRLAHKTRADIGD